MLRYLALGDSYTIGESVPAAQRWPVQLARMLQSEGIAIADPDIIAQTGWTTDELLSGIAQAHPHGPYALVTLLIGVNNQYRGRSLAEYHTELHTLLQQAIELAGDDARRVVVLSIPDWGVTPFAAGRDSARIADEIDDFNAAKLAIAKTFGISYIDITPLTRQLDAGMLADDELHPSGAMYRQWATMVLPLARSILAPQQPH